MRVLKFEVGGNSRQESREGYNELLQNRKEYTQDGGIIVKYNNNGTIDVKGTATKDVDIRFCNSYNSTNVQFTLKSGNHKFSANSNLVYLYLVNKTEPLYPNGSTEGIIQVQEDFDVTYAFMRIKSGTTVDTTLKPLLYLYNGEEKEFEPYGASPSPDYPSEVESCGDNVNLFDKDNINFINAYLANNKTITSTNYVKTYYIECKNNKTYNISKKTGKYFRVATSPKIPTINDTVSQIEIADNDTNIKIITDSNTKYLLFNCRNSQADTLTEQEILDSIKIEESSTPTPYSKYGQGNINVEMCNENKLKTDFTENNKLTVTANREGYYAITDYRVYLEANKTYSFSCKSSLNYGLKTGNGKCICYLMLDKQFDYFIQLISNPKEFTVTKTGYYYLRYDIYDNNTTASFWDFQLEEGTQATNYTPHKSQTCTIPTQKPLRKIGEYKDTFVRKNNKWYERQYIARKIFNGTENWRKNFYAEDIPQYYTNIEKPLLDIVKSNYFYYGHSYENGRSVYMNLNSQLAVFINPILNESSISTLGEWKEWLVELNNSGNPLYIDYVLEEPQDIECTSEQTEILDKIENEAKTYKGVTHIYSTDKVEPNMEVTYLKDIEMMIGG